MILFFSEDTDFSLKGKQATKRWLKDVALTLGKPGPHYIGNINYIFCSDEYLLQMNREYLGHDYYTDIITFDESTEKEVKESKVSADIYISIDTVAHNGDQYGEGFERELRRVIVHGMLHLIGYDDTTEQLQSVMTEAEDMALAMVEKSIQNG